MDGKSCTKWLVEHRAPWFPGTDNRRRLGGGYVNIAGHGAGNERASLLNGRERSAFSRRDACPLCDRPKIRGPPGRCYTDREARHSRYVRLRVRRLHGGTEQDRDQARERRQCKAGRDGLVQRHQDEPRSGNFRQRRDDPISRFQRRLRQSFSWRRPPERYHSGIADLVRADWAQRPRSHHRHGARIRGVLQDSGCL